MGGPIDTRISPTTPNDLAMRNSMMWFRQKRDLDGAASTTRARCAAVYPGFLQLTSFISMNLDRHINAHMRQFEHLVKGDDDSADSHRAFYDEYLAVMDLTAEFLPADHRGRLQGTAAGTRHLGEPRPKDRSPPSSRPP